VDSFEIERFVSDRPPDIGELRRESVSEGHAFVERAFVEWVEGINRFDREGEGFFLARSNAAVVGMCGLNIDPFLGDPSVGRLRHLYVPIASRRNRIGSHLVAACLDLAAMSFGPVRLRTFNSQAAKFYEHTGFGKVEEETATHSLCLSQVSHSPCSGKMRF
jgi:N-acetylglutamate synthase-like GNAT family acetyltransferase